MAFQVRKAVREKIYTKVALMAPSGGGKTYSSLRLATGMAQEIERETGKKAKILMGNTEGKRGLYYSDEFDYDIVDIEAPHEPEKYVDFIQFAVDEGYDIVIIDSSSAEWEGKGGCLELQQKAGGTYQAWGKITPRHDRFINAIALSPIHVIATMRGKDQYETAKDEKTGKMSVQKLGVGAKQRDGFEYEFTCTFLIDQKTNCAEVQKDNTHIFENEGAVRLTEAHGEKIIKWANNGSGYTPKPFKSETTEEKVETTPEVEETTDELATTKSEIIVLAKELGVPKNEEVMALIKKYISSGNPNGIKDLDAARELLVELKNYKENK